MEKYSIIDAFIGPYVSLVTNKRTLDHHNPLLSITF
jgi:hypothetical protein